MGRGFLKVAINLAFISTAVYLGVGLGYRVIASNIWQLEMPSIKEDSAKDFAKRGGISSPEAGSIIARNLFGSVVQKEPEVRHEPKVEKPEPLKPSSLKASLIGTVTGSDGVSRAVIEDNEKKRQGLYRIGDTLQGAAIKEIARGMVVFRVGGRDEVLLIKDKSSGKLEGRGVTPSGSSSAAGSRSEVTVKKQDIESSFANLNDLLTQMRIKPYFADGKPAGLAVAWVKPESFFTNMGLKGGDVIQSINDSPITGADDIMAVYKDLRIGSDISIQVLRDRKIHTISYRFE